MGTAGSHRRIEAYLGEVGRSLEWPSESGSGGCFQLYSKYLLQIQAVTASIARDRPHSRLA
jgi:hypothetical protein